MNRQVGKALQQGNIPLGLGFKDVEVIAHDVAVNDHLMVYGVDDSLRKQIVFSIVVQVNKDYFESVTLIDTVEYRFIEQKEDVTHYLVGEEETRRHLTNWIETIHERSQELSNARQKGRETPVFSKHRIIISNVEEFNKAVQIEDEDATTLVDLSRAVGIYFVLAGHHDYIYRNREALPMKIRGKLTATIVAMLLNDQGVFSVKYISNEPVLGKDEVYYYAKGNIIKIKMPRVLTGVTV